MAKLLAGIELPKNNNEIAEHARGNADLLEYPDPALSLIDHLPDRSYASMADLMKGVGRVYEGQSPFYRAIPR